MVKTNAIWSVKESRQNDQSAIALGVPFLSLMETAGAKAAKIVADRQRHNSTILILVGPGANGGDGLVVARYLARSFRVILYLVADIPRFSGGVELLAAARHYGVEVTSAPLGMISHADLVVDAVYGTGFHGGFSDPLLIQIWQKLHQLQTPIVALDILSGTDANTGSYSEPSVNVTATVTFGAAKWGHFGYPAAQWAHPLYVADIGLPGNAAQGQWMTPGAAKKLLPRGEFFNHKYQRGRVVVIGGAPHMIGAPVLTAESAMRAGAGLVSLIVPEGVLSRIHPNPSLIVKGGASTNEGYLRLSKDDYDMLQTADVVVVGPGLGRKSPNMIPDILRVGRPTLIDGDGLYYVSLDSAFRQYQQPVILTPHSGEMARLMNRTSKEVDSRRYEMLVELAQDNIGVVLKGPYTLSHFQEKTIVNTSGGPELATAGSGDVLAGIIAGIWAQGADVIDAMSLGAYLHGLTGQLSQRDLTGAVLATDLIERIGEAWRDIDQGTTPPKGLPIEI